ncbi:polysaccharide deacetylase family protein [Agarivorans sp. QJM3NY_33]|uniref:polysaccharide deacetylase family protein n=1 Tax=Agarivorans sp. QJM3NY_33 TaxID=3421432 RepID=UPI003D7D2F95
MVRDQFESNTWWSKNIPCLHRVHDELPIKGAQSIQNTLGMSISLPLLDQKIQQLLNVVLQSNQRNNLKQKILLTFDDGHKDILQTVPLLLRYPNIQPILFITGNQLRGDTRPLPLTALYTWCFAHHKDPNSLKEELGFDRRSLKLLSEEKQRIVLDKSGVDLNPDGEQMVDHKDLDFLINNNWLVGYHGSHHCDLRIHQPHELKSLFKEDYKLLSNLDYMPWLAWPEGRWNNQLYTMAKEIGFDVQFGLKGEKGIGTIPEIMAREIWK